jgi:putative ABC transport system substrate-binding protein
MTGVITNRPHERRLQILTEIYPETDSIYYLYSTMTGEAEAVREQVEAVAADLGVEVVPAPITDVASALTLLENTPEGVDWLFLTPFVPFDQQFTDALRVVSTERNIGITWVTDDAFPGYLMGYGPNIGASEAQAAQVVDRILRGASPADLPVQTAENYLMVNLEAAAALNIDIPESILRQANLIVRPGYFDDWEFGFGS